MEKEKIIEKLNIKNYNREFENILQKKTFSEVCNNLLLSMLYKIENAYEDYKKVKINVPNKKDYIEDLLNIIKNDCDTIDIVKLDSEEAIELDSKKKKVDVDMKKITTYQNELTLLEAIYELNSNIYNIFSTDLIKGKAISNMLNIGEIAFKCEPLRDFDGWSWNTNIKEIDFLKSLIYFQLIVLLIGYENLATNKNLRVNDLEKILKEKYKPQLAEKLLKEICQIAIVEYIKNNKNEIDYFIQEREDIINKYNLINDKKTYIEAITNEKKKCIKEIEEIDKYINNDLELKREYIRQNELLSQEERVFSLSDFSENVEKKKKILNDKIAELTEKLKPQNFIKEKVRIENNYKYINELDFENIDNNNFFEDFIKNSLKAFEEQIKETLTKKEIIDVIFQLRYINLLYLDDQTTIGKHYKKQIDKIGKKIITMACNQKIITILSQDVEENYTIYKNIFETRIIDLENVYIEIEKTKIKIYDENSCERETQYNKFNDLKVKYNKKIRIFI